MSDYDPPRPASPFDRTMGALEGLPDVTRTKPTTHVVTTPLIGAVQTFIVQTARQRDVGDWVFVQYVDDQTTTRIVIPPVVADAIARQRDALTSRVRSKAAQARVADATGPVGLAKIKAEDPDRWREILAKAAKGRKARAAKRRAKRARKAKR